MRRLTILALLSTTVAVSIVEMEKNEIVLTELNRFVGSNGQPINLAEEPGKHLRIELTQKKKYHKPRPADKTVLMYAQSHDCAITDEETKTLLAQRGIKIDRDNGCALNNKGDPMKVTVATTNLDDMIYASEFFVGNPPQRMTGVFDTGSTNLWVLGNHTKLSGDPEKKASYDQAASSTAKKTNQSAEIFFGSGSLKGNFVYDDFRLGGCDKESGGLLHIKKQKFGVADEATTIFDGTNFEAIVGLAYPELAEDGVTPVFDRLIQQKSLQSNVFAFFMSYEKEEDKKPHYKPELTLGYYDLAKIKGTIDWHPVLLKYMFGVKLDDIKVNGKPLNVCSRLMKPDACMLTIDSGSTTGMVPIAAIPAFTENSVPIANTMAECNGVQDIGSITWVINGHDYTLNADEWLMEQEIDFAQRSKPIEIGVGPLGPQMLVQLEDEKKPKIPEGTHLLHKANSDPQKKMCVSLLAGMNIHEEMFLVGDIFMRKFYTIFDRDNDRVGLARAITKTTEISDPSYNLPRHDPDFALAANKQ